MTSARPAWVRPCHRRRLKLSVDAAVPLFEPTRIPGKVDVEEAVAVRLEIDALAGGVGGHENAKRVLLRMLVEGALDGLTFVRGRGTVVDRDAKLGEMGFRNRGAQHLDQVTLGVVVLREDQEPQVVPRGIGLRGPLAGLGHAGTHLAADPVDHEADPRIGQAAALVSHDLHLREQTLLGGNVSPLGIAGRGDRGGFDLLGDQSVLIFLLELGAVVVSIEPSGEKVEVRSVGHHRAG